MHVDVLTLFPGMVAGMLEYSILKRARDAGFLSVDVHNLRDFTHDRHHVVDDYPFGGGNGMVLKPEPVFEAVEATRSPGQPVILMAPTGEPFTQAVAAELARLDAMLLVCGHYEGFDERIHKHLADRELSIGDYVLTGGELPAMVILDAVARLIPGVLSEGSADDDSFSTGVLEYPQYTRPAVFRGWRVPGVLTSGDHGAVRRWRQAQAEERTRRRRPDLLSSGIHDSPAVPSSSGPRPNDDDSGVRPHEDAMPRQQSESGDMLP